MANNYHQISLKNTFSDCKDMFIDNVPSFFQLLEQQFDISRFITQTFYQRLGRKRDYHLTGFLSALIPPKIFTIPTDSLLILLLNLCNELRNFCGFSQVPSAPHFTRFKLDFEGYIKLMFQQTVEYTEPICQQIDSLWLSFLPLIPPVSSFMLRKTHTPQCSNLKAEILLQK